MLDPVAVQDDGALAEDVARGDVEHRGLACAVRSDNAHDLTRVDVHVDVIDRSDAAERAADIDQLERRSAVGTVAVRARAVLRDGLPFGRGARGAFEEDRPEDVGTIEELRRWP